MSNVLDMAQDITRAARSVAIQWPGTISADDCEQEIFVRLLESPGSVAKLLGEMDDRERYGSLVRVGHQIASGYRADFEVFSGNFRYSVGEVKSLLKGGILTKERTDVNPSRLDVDEALELINQNHAQVLGAEFVMGDFDKSTSTARTQLSRAVEALTDSMNKVYRNRQVDYDSGPGTRKAISNGHAQAKTSNQVSE